MGATIIASLYKLPIQVPIKIRTVFLGVLGAFLGSSFSAQSTARLLDWPISLMSVVLFVALITVAMAFYYKKVAGLDAISAIFSATPGGLTPMVVIGAASGGNEQHIALTQGLRVVLVVFLTPALIFGLLGYEHGANDLQDIPFNLEESLLLFIVVAAGIYVAQKIRLPAPQLTGAMFSSAALHLSGVVSHALPDLLLGITLWVLGSAIGSRFSGIAL